jgi:hypothetical protein
VIVRCSSELGSEAAQESRVRNAFKLRSGSVPVRVDPIRYRPLRPLALGRGPACWRLQGVNGRGRADRHALDDTTRRAERRPVTGQARRIASPLIIPPPCPAIGGNTHARGASVVSDRGPAALRLRRSTRLAGTVSPPRSRDRPLESQR